MFCQKEHSKNKLNARGSVRMNGCVGFRTEDEREAGGHGGGRTRFRPVSHKEAVWRAEDLAAAGAAVLMI